MILHSKSCFSTSFNCFKSAWNALDNRERSISSFDVQLYYWKLKMFSLMTTSGLGWFDTMLWVICKYFASHEPIKSIVYYDFVILVRVCLSNFVRLQRLLRWFYQEFDNFQCSGWDVVIKYHFISSSSCRRNLWLYHISYFSKKNVPSC